MILTLSLTVSLFFLLLTLFSFRNEKQATQNSDIGGLSIIIPFRNEATNLPTLLATLLQQECSLPFEIVLINDGSTDDYQGVLQKYPEVRCISSDYSLAKALTSKQQALDTGVEQAQYDWLVFTDADMIFDPLWLQSLVITAQKSGNPFVFGRTSMRPTTLFGWFQKGQLDFLFAIAWLFTRARFDSSCMGNNILIQKKLYASLGGQAGLGYTIVEDQALLKAIKGRGISPLPAVPFLAKAFTHPEPTYSRMVHQMLRWARGGAKGSWQLWLAMVMFGGYLLLLPVSLYQQELFLFALPSIVLLGLLLRSYQGSRQLTSLVTFPIIILWIALQAVIVGSAMLWMKPVWKGHQLK